MTRSVKIITLGCPKNEVDSEQMRGYLYKEGYRLTTNSAEAEIIIINTCGFVEAAKRESIETILDYARYKRDGSCKKLVVTGCLVQKYAGELQEELPEVDLFLGTGDVPALPELLRSLQPGARTAMVGDPANYLFDDELPHVPEHVKHYAYLKIAEGCDNCCSYCVIPSLRGPYRSRSMEAIIKDARELAALGVKELILVAQDTTLYGMDLYGDYKLSSLLKELAGIAEIEWIRLLYCYPNHLTDELLLTIRDEPKVCSYLDIPLQHIADPILQAMGRRISKQETVELLAKIRRMIPGITLRSTFIVGFPGESKDHFQELLNFIAETRFDRVGFFAYSPEPDTPAAKMAKQVSMREKQRRLQEAEAVQAAILAEKQAEYLNRTVTVIVDGPSEDYEGLWEGRTQGDAPEIDGVVYFQPAPATKPGAFLQIRITHSQEYALVGEISDESCK